MFTVEAGQTAFITGGGQGIGLAIATALAHKGVKVAIADVDEEALSRAASMLSEHTTVQAHSLDVRDREAFAHIADDVEHALGPVDLLINNAGIAAGAPMADMTYADWDWVLGINFGGVVNGIQTFVPRMLGRGAPAYIVNTASGAGLVATNSGVLYTTSKFAVVGLSEALRLELEPRGIGVSVLCPGPVATRILQNTKNLSDTAPDAPVLQQAAADEALESVSAFLAAGTDPADVASMVLDAIDAGRLHIFTDRLIHKLLVARHDQLLAALPGNQRY